MEIQRDTNGQPYIEWCQFGDRWKRAWVQCRRGDADWAETGRYLNVVHCSKPGRPAGNATDFPIFNDLPDAQILYAFVYGTNAITSLRT